MPLNKLLWRSKLWSRACRGRQCTRCGGLGYHSHHHHHRHRRLLATPCQYLKAGQHEMTPPLKTLRLLLSAYVELLPANVVPIHVRATSLQCVRHRVERQAERFGEEKVGQAIVIDTQVEVFLSQRKAQARAPSSSRSPPPPPSSSSSSSSQLAHACSALFPPPPYPLHDRAGALVP